MGPAAAGGRAGPLPRPRFRGTVAWARHLTWRVAGPSISAVRVRLGNTRPAEAKVTVTSDPGERRAPAPPGVRGSGWTPAAAGMPVLGKSSRPGKCQLSAMNLLLIRGQADLLTAR